MSQTFALPVPPQGDPAAARRAARALRTAADEIMAAQGRAHDVLAAAHQCWTGRSAAAADHPLQELDATTHQVAGSLRSAAAELERYAAALDRAHEQHHWSWKKVLTIAAVVTVTTAAVVITIGAATPAAAAADAAIVGAEVTATGAAVTAAGVAAGEAADAVLLAVRALRTLRAVATFVRPQVVITAAFTDLDAVQQVASTGSVSVGRLGADAAVGAVGGAFGVRFAGAAAARFGSEAGNPLGRWAAPHLAAGATWGGIDAVAQLATTGSVEPGKVSDSALFGIVGSGLAARSAARAEGRAEAAFESPVSRPASAVNDLGQRATDLRLARLLRRQLANEAQLTEADKEVVFGDERVLNDAAALAARYGGDPADWAKVTSTVSSDGPGLYDLWEVHGYRNLRTGEDFEWKTKFPRAEARYMSLRLSKTGAEPSSTGASTP